MPRSSGPRIERHLLVKRARAQGFVILDCMDCWEAWVATPADWVRAGTAAAERGISQSGRRGWGSWHSLVASANCDYVLRA